MSTFERHWYEEQRARANNYRARANGQWHGASTAIKITPFESIKLEENHRPYLIHGLIPAKGLTVAWGPPKCGKTFSVTDMLMHIALVWDYPRSQGTAGCGGLLLVRGPIRTCGQDRGVQAAAS